MIYKSDGSYPMNHWVNPDCTHPIIYTDNGSAAIRVSVGVNCNVYVGALLGDILNSGGYLTEVTYTASWEGNKPHVVYTGTADDREGGFVFNLTGIPYGNHTISVTAKSVVLLFTDDFASTYPGASSRRSRCRLHSRTRIRETELRLCILRLSRTHPQGRLQLCLRRCNRRTIRICSSHQHSRTEN